MMKKHILILITVSGVLLPCRSQTDSSAVIYAWKLEDDFTRLVPEDIDTNLPDFQRYYLNYENSISNAYLGNLGSPTISNVYTSRIYNDDVFFLNSYLPYFHTSENTIYYNTRKPFTRLSYYIGPGLHVTNIIFD